MSLPSLEGTSTTNSLLRLQNRLFPSQAGVGEVLRGDTSVQSPRTIAHPPKHNSTDNPSPTYSSEGFLCIFVVLRDVKKIPLLLTVVWVATGHPLLQSMQTFSCGLEPLFKTAAPGFAFSQPN